MNLDLSKIVDIECDGIDHNDYPDYCDSYVSRAFYDLGDKQFRELTEEELNWLNETQRDWVYEKVWDWIH